MACPTPAKHCSCTTKWCNGVINRSGLIEPQSTQAVEPDLIVLMKNHHTILRVRWWMLCHGEPNAIDVLAPIPHFIWMHGLDLTSLGHNVYTVIISIQNTEHPSCGTRFGNKFKPPWDPQGGEYWYMKNYIPYMCYHPSPFHVSCVCLVKDWQAWDSLNISGCH